MKNIVTALINIGITEDLDSREIRRITYINFMAVLMLVYQAIRVLLTLSDPDYVIILLSSMSITLSILIMNWFHFHQAAKISILVFWSTGLTTFSYLFAGGFSGTYAILFTAVSWPFILFDIKQKVHIFASLAFVFSCFATLIVLDHVHPIPPLPVFDSDISKISINILTIFLLIGGTWYFYSSNIAAEEKLAEEKDKSEAANLAKSRFLANMSHELRTPLNVILGFSQLLAREPNLSKEQLANLETIGRSGEHLLSLINDVLELSKIEAGKIELYGENFDLHQLLLNLESMFRMRAHQKGLSLQFTRSDDVPRYIRSDRNKLSQVLINLLGNAVKFTEHGGITLSIECRQKNDADQHKACRLHFTVSDTGVGIAENEQNKIFDTFSQANGSHTSKEGTGLGLSISRKFVELMGGKLAVDSIEGQGSHFFFDIPVEIAEHSDKESYFSKKRVIGLAPGQPEFRLLVAEDNLDSRELLATLLRSVGFKVREAINGREAIDLWKEWQPQLIWMDIRMPEVDGLQAIQRIRKQPGGDKTKIIALTANTFEEDQNKIMACGGDDFLRKPFAEAEMFNLMEKHLGVQFQLADTHSTSTSETLSERFDPADIHSYLHAIPDEIRDDLKKAIHLGQVESIEGIIVKISKLNLELGEFLKKLADDFAYDEISAYLSDK